MASWRILHHLHPVNADFLTAPLRFFISLTPHHKHHQIIIATIVKTEQTYSTYLDINKLSEYSHG